MLILLTHKTAVRKLKVLDTGAVKNNKSFIVYIRIGLPAKLEVLTGCLKKIHNGVFCQNWTRQLKRYSLNNENPIVPHYAEAMY